MALRFGSALVLSVIALWISSCATESVSDTTDVTSGTQPADCGEWPDTLKGFPVAEWLPNGTEASKSVAWVRSDASAVAVGLCSDSDQLPKRAPTLEAGGSSVEPGALTTIDSGSGSHQLYYLYPPLNAGTIKFEGSEIGSFASTGARAADDCQSRRSPDEDVEFLACGHLVRLSWRVPIDLAPGEKVTFVDVAVLANRDAQGLSGELPPLGRYVFDSVTPTATDGTVEVEFAIDPPPEGGVVLTVNGVEITSGSETRTVGASPAHSDRWTVELEEM